MTYKSTSQDFQTSWTKTVNWAKSQGIGMQSIYPVYQMDSKRLLSGGYIMSEAERTRAILASANPNNVTPLPQDTQTTGSGLFGGIEHFFGNTVHDAANIFTGLNPTKLIPSIVDGVVNTVEHPSWVLDPTKNTLAQWIPGVAVLGELEQGGFSNVFSHPLISFLDVLPLADTGVGVLAKAGLGAGIAERAGIPETLLGRSRLLGQDAQNGVGALSLARRLIGNTKTGKEGLFMDADGNPTFGQMTVSRRMKNYFNAHMSGSEQAKIAGSMIKVTSAASHDLARISQGWDEAYAKLSDDEKTQAYDIWTGLDRHLGGNDRQTLVNDNRLSPEMKTFFQEQFRIVDWVQEKKLAAGDQGGEVMMPNGTVEWRAGKGMDKRVTDARASLANKLDQMDQASKEADRLSKEIEANDTIAEPAFEMMWKFRNQINRSQATPLSQPGFMFDPGRLSRAKRTEYAALRNRMEESRATQGDSPYHAAAHLANQQRLNTFIQKYPNVKASVDEPTIAQLLGRDKVTVTQVRLVNEIFGVNGLVDKVAAAYRSKDFDEMRRLTLALNRKFQSKTLSSETANPLFATAKTLADNLYKYAKARKRAEDDLRKAIVKGRLHQKVEAYAKAEKQFNKMYRDYPAADWQPLLVRLQVEDIAKSEEGKIAVAKAVEKYKSEGQISEEVQKEMQEDPARMIGLIMAHTKASSTSVFGGMLSPEQINRSLESAKNEIEVLRARGFTPRWVPNVSAADAARYGDYHVKISPVTHMTPESAGSKIFDMRNTVYDIHAGWSKEMYQQVARDANIELIDDIFIPGNAFHQKDLEDIISKMQPNWKNLQLADREAELARILEFDWNLTRFDPDSIFKISSKHVKGDDTLWVPKDMLEGLKRTVEKNQVDPSGGLAKGTQIFRSAVLGYSPRFIAHIGLGGTFLLALRHPFAFRFIPDALKMMKDPDFRAQIHTTSTQIGYDKPESMGAMAFHEATGKTAVYHLGQHMMEKLNLDPSKMTSWLKVIPQLTFKLTNLMTDMQRSMVYLDGAASAERRGYFIDPESGERVEMTAARAQEEGMRAANRTMGNLSSMSPFERSWLTTLMPFYGWTKHTLTYVAEYPADHPYRAMFLANLATMNSDEVAKGLYTRIQNLFFLGTPDQYGNVSALDVRALNPLRDVANYATWGGIISSLNPAIAAPFAAVDPEIVFGSNTLYPNVTYNQLYGTKEASASGGLLTAAEQFVPELTTVDAALGLSAQYRGLQRSNPGAFTKLIFESLNIPFAQVQHINLKQIAATQEIDRYQQASQAAQNAFQSGDFGALSGYTSVPNPLQADYNINPAALQELYNSTLASTGLPPSEVLPSLPTPAGL